MVYSCARRDVYNETAISMDVIFEKIGHCFYRIDQNSRFRASSDNSKQTTTEKRYRIYED